MDNKDRHYSYPLASLISYWKYIKDKKSFQSNFGIVKISRAYKSFLNGRFVSEGVRITAGIIMPAIICSFFGALKEGIVLSIGALCVSAADAAGPLHHRKNAMLVCSVLIFLVSLITGSAAGNSITLALLLVFFSFIFSMFSIYGARIASIGIACLLIMVLNLEHPLTGMALILNSVYILYGGVWYMCFTLILHRLRPYKLVQQVLGEVIESTADYLVARALFYKEKVDYNMVYQQLMQKQAIVQEKQSMASDIIFKTRTMVKETTNTGRILVMIFMEVTDLFERVMTSYQQYEDLHTSFDDTTILKDLRNLLLALADDLRDIGLAVKAGDHSTYNDELGDIISKTHDDYNQFRLTHMHPDNLKGFLALGRIFESIEDLNERLKVLHHYTSYDRKIIRNNSSLDLNDFIIRQDIDPALFLDSLSLRSNNFRHSVRVSVAVLCGYLISLFFKVGHGYWILLTIIVILKPAYSLTKTRNKDRIIGTALGIIIGVLFLYFIKNNYVLLTVMILFMTASYIFLRTNYFISVLLMTPYLLIFFHLVQPLEFRAVLFDRLLDTAIGSTIAFLANIFFIPAWEYTTLKMYMAKMLETNSVYYKSVATVYVNQSHEISGDFQSARKNVLIALANLSDAFNRMLSEPKRQQLNPDTVHKFVVLNHTLTSHIATLSYYFKRAPDRHTSNAFMAVIEDTQALLNNALKALTDPSIATSVNKNKENIKLINKEADSLLEKRKVEVAQGLLETETKNLLIRIKPVVDQFSYIYSLANDIVKVSQKMSIGN